MLPYIPFIIATAQRYRPDAGSGTIVTLMIPYSVVFIVLWSTLLMMFYTFGWPIGPGVHMELPR